MLQSGCVVLFQFVHVGLEVMKILFHALFGHSGHGDPDMGIRGYRTPGATISGVCVFIFPFRISYHPDKIIPLEGETFGRPLTCPNYIRGVDY